VNYQIIKQPNGKLAIFSPFSGTIALQGATAEGVAEWFADRAAEGAREEARRKIKHVVAGNPRKVYFQFAMTWEEALAEDREHGGTAWEVMA
jgi:hypothetical protein